MAKGLQLAIFMMSMLWLNFSSAKALRCENVFVPSVLEIIQQIDRDSHGYLSDRQTVDFLLKDVSWARKRKLRSLLTRQDLHHLVSEKAVERYAVELTTVLFGKKEALNRFVFKNKEQRLEESTTLLIKEQLLRQGLMGFWKENHDPSKVKPLKQLFDHFVTLQKVRLYQVVQFPLMIPQLKNARVPESLMLKILRDGFDVHANEVRWVLRSQNKIEAYNTFQRYYSPMFFAVLLGFTAHVGYGQLMDLHNNQVDDFVRQISEAGRQIESSMADIRSQEIEKAYQGAVLDFRQKWGEDPTAEEALVLRQRITQALRGG